MPSRHLLTLCCLLLPVLGATPGMAEESLLYAPQATTLERAPADPRQGVLVKTVTVKRGDTLKKLSRQHIGVAGWFPQVLLFNTIKNPDLIHPGDRLLVPVRTGQAASRPGAAKDKKAQLSRRPGGKPAAAPAPRQMQTVTLGELETFQQARRAYQDRDYQKALDRFSSFLRSFPRSGLAADAALYRADCLLRLSGE